MRTTAAVTGATLALFCLLAGQIGMPVALATAATTATAGNAVGLALVSGGQGWWVAGRDGSVTTGGSAPSYGSAAGLALTRPVVGIAATPSGHGYWLVASDGGIFAFGDAAFYGSTGSIRLNQPIVGMTAAASGAGPSGLPPPPAGVLFAR